MLLSLSLYLNIVKALIIITDYAVINKEVPSLSLSCGEGGWDKEKPFE